MAPQRQDWLSDLSRAFKRHRQGRPGWFLRVKRDRLRLLSDELPPRPDETGDAPRQRELTLSTPPGPATAAASLAEACGVFDAVMAGTWRWPDPNAMPAGDDAAALEPANLTRLVERLKSQTVGEKITQRTRDRHYQPYLSRLVESAPGSDPESLLRETLQRWPAGSRARQMAHDRFRVLWKVAEWPWPDSIASMRGTGKAAVDPRGVRAFSDEEISELRARILESRLSPSVLTAWDCLAVFGLRPVELQGLEVEEKDGVPIANVTRGKTNSHGTTAHRSVVAVPPRDWPPDCFDLVQRIETHGIARHLTARQNVGDRMAHQLVRLRLNRQVSIPLPADLRPYSLRHAYAIRLATHLGLSVRESAELMGHSPAVHLQTYGRRLDQPKLLDKVTRLVAAQAKA